MWKRRIKETENEKKEENREPGEERKSVKEK